MTDVTMIAQLDADDAEKRLERPSRGLERPSSRFAKPSRGLERPSRGLERPSNRLKRPPVRRPRTRFLLLQELQRNKLQPNIQGKIAKHEHEIKRIQDGNPPAATRQWWRDGKRDHDIYHYREVVDSWLKDNLTLEQIFSCGRCLTICMKI